MNEVLSKEKIEEITRQNNPQTLEDIHFAWSKDTEFMDTADPGIILDKLSKLHSKYSQAQDRFLIAAKRTWAEYSKLRKLRYAYYRGDLNSDPEELKKMKWEPNPKKIDATQMKEYLEGDEALVTLKLKYEEEVLAADAAGKIITAIKDKNYAAGNVIKWRMFKFDGS
jgi:hypothetical protein